MVAVKYPPPTSSNVKEPASPLPGTNGVDEPNIMSACTGQNSATWNPFISRIQEDSPCTGRQERLLCENIRRSEGVGKLIRQLFQCILVVFCILLLLYPAEQLAAQFLLPGNWGTFWDISSFVGISYFGFYIMERLILLHVAVVAGAKPVKMVVFLGMDAITKDNIGLEMGINTVLILLVSGICFTFGMVVFPQLLADKWQTQNINMGETEQLNITTAATNHFNTTIQSSLNRAIQPGEIIWGILWISSKCLNYTLEFISTGALIIVHFNFMGIMVAQNITATVERDTFFKRLVKNFERFTKVIRLWTKIYFWILYFYDQILESFSDIQDAIYLLGIRYGLGILSMGITYCYINFIK